MLRLRCGGRVWAEAEGAVSGLSFGRLQELHPGFRGGAMRRIVQDASGVDGGHVLRGGDGDADDGIADLLLEGDLGRPGDSGVGLIGQNAHGRLTMVNLGEARLAAGDLGDVDGVIERVSTGVAQRCADLARDAFPGRVGHAEAKIGTREVVERVDGFRVARGNHDGEIVGGVTGGVIDLTGGLHSVENAGACLVHIGDDAEGEVAEGERVIMRDLLAQDAGREGFIEDAAAQFGVKLLEARDQLGQNEELVASYEEHELGVGGIAVEIGSVIDIADGEGVAAIGGGIVVSSRPGRQRLRVSVRLRQQRLLRSEGVRGSQQDCRESERAFHDRIPRTFCSGFVSDDLQIAVVADGLKHGDRADDAGDDDDSGDGVREHLMDDLFGLRGQVETLDEDARLEFGGHVATEKGDAARLQSLDAGVHLGRAGIAGVGGGVMERGPGWAGVKEVADCGLAGLRVVEFEPFADLVLLPDEIVVVHQIGSAMERGDDLHLIHGHAEAVVHGVEGVAQRADDFAALDDVALGDETDFALAVQKRLECRERPLVLGPDDLGFSGRCGDERGGDTDGGLAEKTTACGGGLLTHGMRLHTI